MRHARKVRADLVTGAGVMLALLAPGVGRACSICRCGDPTFNALGADGYAAPGFSPAVDWERFDKDEGDPAEESESQVENRVTALLSYRVHDAVSLFVRVPYSVRDLTSTGPSGESEALRTRGFSDPEVYGQFRVWSSPIAGDVGRRASLLLGAGVKTPWGENGLTQDGERVDEHAQPGTGSTDVFGSGAFLYLIDARSSAFASVGLRHTGTNDAGYRYGSTVQGSVAYEHKLGALLDGVCELDYRDAARDRIDASGAEDEDTGGSLLYFTPRLLVDLGSGAVLRLAGQIPIARGLHGTQTEHSVVDFGMTYLFSR